MVDYCANPKCLKPLHYLREGTVYLFDVRNALIDGGKARGHRLEHYWLCGVCSGTYLLERSADQELRLVQKGSRRDVRKALSIADRALAS